MIRSCRVKYCSRTVGHVIRSTMGLCFIGKLLLTTLVFHLTEQNAEWETQITIKPENTVRYGEFCLRISDDSPVPEPVTQPPVMSAHPTQNATQQPEPTGEPSRPTLQLNRGCQCNKENTKQPTETFPMYELKFQFPNENCPTVEITKTLSNKKKVCVSIKEAQAHLEHIFLSFGLIPEHQPFMVAAPDIPGTELPTSALPTSTLEETTQDNLEIIVGSSEEVLKTSLTDTEDDDSSLVLQRLDACEFCNITRYFNNIDPESVQSINLNMSCFDLIYYSLKDGKVFCFFTKHLEFMALLEKLEYLHANGDHFNHIQNNITDGCRCQDKKKKVTMDETSVNSTTIWLMSEKCNSTEYIETLENGTEVCVTAPSIREYLLSLILMRRIVSSHKTHEAESLPPIRSKTEPVYQELDFTSDSSSALSERIFGSFECVQCAKDSWETTDPKDVESMQMQIQSPNCPAMLHVNLKNKTSICVDSTQPSFSDVLSLTLTVIQDDT